MRVNVNANEGIQEFPTISDDFRQKFESMIDSIKSVAMPKAYGVEFGLQWAPMVDLKTLKEVVEHPTTSEQLIEHLEFYAECEARGEVDDGNIPVFSPVTESGFAPEAQEAFFRWAVEVHPMFQGVATCDDPSINHPFEGGGSYFVSEVPVAAFRAFEDGWSSAVREYYAFVTRK